jgi:hypothetical protein
MMRLQCVGILKGDEHFLSQHTSEPYRNVTVTTTCQTRYIGRRIRRNDR